MSHFVVLVITKKTDPKAAKRTADALLDPYGENNEDYFETEECKCVDPNTGKPDKKCKECDGSGEINNGNPQGRWDWYEFGGRWTGMYSGYQPSKDQRNFEKCDICNGTGMRNDELGKKERRNNPKYTCNGCSGTGKSFKFQLAPHSGDILPVEAVLANYKKVGPPYAVLTPDGGWHSSGKMGWFGMSKGDKDEVRWHKEVKKLLKAHVGMTALVVDCHS